MSCPSSAELPASTMPIWPAPKESAPPVMRASGLNLNPWLESSIAAGPLTSAPAPIVRIGKAAPPTFERTILAIGS